MNHIVAISGGKDSTAMALRLAEAEPRDYQFWITPTGRELPEMVAHWKRIEVLLSQPLRKVTGPTLVQAILANRALPNWRMRFCTPKVKIEPFLVAVLEQAPAVTYVGIRADEPGRVGTDWGGAEITQDFPLARWGWGLREVRDYLARRKVNIPKRTDCDWCFYQRLIEWYELWRDHRDRYEEGVAMEKLFNHTFRSDKRDTWPASLERLAAEFAAGRVPSDTRKEREREVMCAWCAR